MKQRVILCTGGIGCGKSVVVRALRELGCPSYDCDRSAKELYDRDPELLSGVVRLAGPEVLDAGGRLDRAALAARIFADPALLEGVEALVHPAVLRDFALWRASRPEPLVVLESAILLDRPVPPGVFDFVLLVTAPEDVRIARVMARDGVSEAEVRRRMARQGNEAAWKGRADLIVENDDRQAMLPVLMNMIEQLQENGKD